MKEQVAQILEQIEQRFGVQILFALESGSRMWGFASTDSDYDVRFVYKHTAAQYCGVYEPTQVLDINSFDKNAENPETPLWAHPLDFAGWDIRKALHLTHMGNATLGEWVRSPIIYRDHPVRDAIHCIARTEFQQQRYFQHYRSRARADLMGNPEKFGVKKALYALRCLLSAHWVFYHNTLHPVELKVLVDQYRQSSSVEPDASTIKELYEVLYSLKMTGAEQSRIPDEQQEKLLPLLTLHKWCGTVGHQVQQLSQERLDALGERCSAVMTKYVL